MGSDKGPIHRALGAEKGHHLPVFLGLEGSNFTLAVHNQSNGHGLHTAGRKLPGQLATEQGAKVVPHHPIQEPPGLLGLDAVHVNFTRVFERGLNRFFGDFVEGDPFHLIVGK